MMITADELNRHVNLYRYEFRRDRWEWLLETTAGKSVWEVAEIKLELMRQPSAARAFEDEHPECWRGDWSNPVYREWSRLRGLDRHKAEQEKELEYWLAMVWAKQGDFAPTRAEGMATKLFTGERYHALPHDLFDHPFYFRRGGRSPSRRDEWVIASHPYNVWDSEKGCIHGPWQSDAEAWCGQHGAEFSLPDYPSWWFPGWTKFVLWRPRRDAVEIRRAYAKRTMIRAVGRAWA